MVRLIKSGNKIKVLPLKEGEGITCRNCGEEFNGSTKKRGCYDNCRHESCLECIFKMIDGCFQCKLNDREDQSASRMSLVEDRDSGEESPGVIEEEEEDDDIIEIDVEEEEEDQSEIDEEEDGIIVISSVLRKSKENGNMFPEIRSLSMSALPVLECMTTTTAAPSLPVGDEEEDLTPIVITLDDDEDEEVDVEGIFMENEVEPPEEIILEGPSGPIELEGPSVPNNMEVPLEPINLEEPPGPIDVEEPPEIIDLEEPLEPIDVEEPHGPINMEGPLQLIDVEEPPEEIILEGPSEPIQVVAPPEENEEDDDIQEVPIEEYTKLAGEEDEEEERNEEEENDGEEIVEIENEEEDDDSDVQSVTSHVTVIDPFQFSDDDDNNPRDYEPTPRNLRKRRFSQLTLPSDWEEEDDDFDDEYLGYVQTTLKNHGRKRFSQSSSQSSEEADDHEDLDNEEEIGGRGFGKYICKHCSSRFTIRLSLARHLARHHKERRPFSCTLCGWPFHTQRNLENHMMTHTNERPFKCSHCDGAYNRKFTLDNHLEKIHGIITPKRGRGQRSTSNPQNQSTPTDKDAPATSQMATSSLTVSQSSGSTEENQPEVGRHEDLEDNLPNLSYQEEGPVPSPALSSSVSSDDSSEHKENKQTGRRHKGALLKRIYMRNSRKGGQQKKKKRRKCKQCKITFDRKYNLDRHFRNVHLKIPRKKGFKTRQLLAGSSKNGQRYENEGKYVCKVCDVGFEKKRDLIAHLKLKCKICGKENFGSLERHLEKCHGIRVRWREKMEQERRSGNGGKYCPECQSLFKEGGDGGDEVVVEEEELSEKVWYAECGHLSCMDCVIKADGLGCGQCTTERVRMEDVLGRFFEGMEDKERRRILEVKVVLRRLEEMEGQENVQWRDLEESVKFRDKVEFVESYKSITTSSGTRTFYCPYCKMEFKEKGLLGWHLQEVHRDKRPFPCDICQWPFSSGKDLERHRIIHTNDKPFRCNLCPETFNRKSTRDRHVEKVHLRWRRI